MEYLQLNIIGSNSAVPLMHRHPTAQVLQMANHHFLIDCGEGTQQRLRKHQIGFGRLEHIFISHLHGDHFYGLVPMLTSLSLLDHRRTLHLHGPASLEDAVRQMLKISGSTLRFPVHFHVNPTGEKAVIFEDDACTVYSFPLAHSLPCFGYLFCEKQRPRKMIKEKIAELNIPVAEIRRIKAGADFTDAQGKLHRNQELSTAPGAPLSYAFCTDTLPLPHLPNFFEGVDLLYHEATFGSEMSERAQQTQHSTAAQAAQQALNTGAEHLLLGHFSVRYTDLKPLLAEAQNIFSCSHLALDGSIFRMERNKRRLEVLLP